MIHDHINEENLGHFLAERISDDFVRDSKIPNHIRKSRPDYRSEKLKLIVEFDGWRHYTRAHNVYMDDIKDDEYRSVGYDVIRVPYFIQLDEMGIKCLFENYTNDFTPFNDYPHGFINPQVCLPADFCHIGLQKFIRQMNGKFHPFIGEVKKSLILKCWKSESGPVSVIPPTLWVPEEKERPNEHPLLGYFEKESKGIRFDPGEYVIGDIALLNDQEDFREHEECALENLHDSFEFDSKGKRCFAFFVHDHPEDAKNSIPVLYDQYENRFDIYEFWLCIFPAEICNDKNAQKFHYKEKFDCYYKNGVIHLGSRMISANSWHNLDFDFSAIINHW